MHERRASTEADERTDRTDEADWSGSLQLRRELAGAPPQVQLERLRPTPPLGVQLKGGGGGSSDIHAVAQAGVRGAGGPLPHLDRIQPSFGSHDLSGVQAHTGAAAQQASATLGARGYATGNDVAFAGSPDLHTAAHEAAHVVQQRGGVQLKGGVGQAGDRWEQHADAVADAVVQGRSAEGLLDQVAGSGGGAAVQLDADPDAPAPAEAGYQVREGSSGSAVPGAEDWFTWEEIQTSAGELAKNSLDGLYAHIDKALNFQTSPIPKRFNDTYLKKSIGSFMAVKADVHFRAKGKKATKEELEKKLKVEGSDGKWLAPAYGLNQQPGAAVKTKIGAFGKASGEIPWFTDWMQEQASWLQAEWEGKLLDAEWERKDPSKLDGKGFEKWARRKMDGLNLKSSLALYLVVVRMGLFIGEAGVYEPTPLSLYGDFRAGAKFEVDWTKLGKFLWDKRIHRKGRLAHFTGAGLTPEEADKAYKKEEALKKQREHASRQAETARKNFDANEGRARELRRELQDLRGPDAKKKYPFSSPQSRKREIERIRAELDHVNGKTWLRDELDEAERSVKSVDQHLDALDKDPKGYDAWAKGAEADKLPQTPDKTPPPHDPKGGGGGGDGGSTEPKGEDAKPKGEDAKPKGEDAKPKGEDPKPKGEDAKPTGEDPKPKGEDPKPKGEDPKPKGEDPKPKGEDPKPKGEDPKPKGEDPKPKGEDPKPKGEDPKPKGDDPKPKGPDDPPGGTGGADDGGKKPPPDGGRAPTDGGKAPVDGGKAPAPHPKPAVPSGMPESADAYKAKRAELTAKIDGAGANVDAIRAEQPPKDPSKVAEWRADRQARMDAARNARKKITQDGAEALTKLDQYASEAFPEAHKEVAGPAKTPTTPVDTDALRARVDDAGDRLVDKGNTRVGGYVDRKPDPQKMKAEIRKRVSARLDEGILRQLDGLPEAERGKAADALKKQRDKALAKLESTFDEAVGKQLKAYEEQKKAFKKALPGATSDVLGDALVKEAKTGPGKSYARRYATSLAEGVGKGWKTAGKVAGKAVPFAGWALDAYAVYEDIDNISKTLDKMSKGQADGLDLFFEVLHLATDLAGFIPVIGDIISLVGDVIYLGKGLIRMTIENPGWILDAMDLMWENMNKSYEQRLEEYMSGQSGGVGGQGSQPAQGKDAGGKGGQGGQGGDTSKSGGGSGSGGGEPSSGGGSDTIQAFTSDLDPEKFGAATGSPTDAVKVLNWEAGSRKVEAWFWQHPIPDVLVEDGATMTLEVEGEALTLTKVKLEVRKAPTGYDRFGPKEIYVVTFEELPESEGGGGGADAPPPTLPKFQLRGLQWLEKRAIYQGGEAAFPDDLDFQSYAFFAGGERLFDGFLETSSLVAKDGEQGHDSLWTLTLVIYAERAMPGVDSSEMRKRIQERVSGVEFQGDDPDFGQRLQVTSTVRRKLYTDDIELGPHYAADVKTGEWRYAKGAKVSFGGRAEHFDEGADSSWAFKGTIKQMKVVQDGGTVLEFDIEIAEGDVNPAWKLKGGLPKDGILRHREYIQSRSVSHADLAALNAGEALTIDLEEASIVVKKVGEEGKYAQVRLVAVRSARNPEGWYLRNAATNKTEWIEIGETTLWDLTDEQEEGGEE